MPTTGRTRRRVLEKGHGNLIRAHVSENPGGLTRQIAEALKKKHPELVRYGDAFLRQRVSMAKYALGKRQEPAEPTSRRSPFANQTATRWSQPPVRSLYHARRERFIDGSVPEARRRLKEAQTAAEQRGDIRHARIIERLLEDDHAHSKMAERDVEKLEKRVDPRAVRELVDRFNKFQVGRIIREVGEKSKADGLEVVVDNFDGMMKYIQKNGIKNADDVIEKHYLWKK